jgi:hypothetical protein
MAWCEPVMQMEQSPAQVPLAVPQPFRRMAVIPLRR